MAAASGVSRPGVGVLFNPTLDRFLARSLDALDYVSVIPDRSWIDHGIGSQPRFESLPLVSELMESPGKALPIVLHGIGLSICSASLFDEEYAEKLIETQRTLRSPWVSEHLSFSRISTGHEINAAVAVPVPYDVEVLELLVPRVSFLTRRASCPVLLENSVYYFRHIAEDMTEAAFLNEVCARTGCGVLLDLHNLYCNALNHSFDPHDYLRDLDMANVVEVHIAGGVEMMGFHTDSHTGPVPEPVWELLADVVPRALNLRGVTFEFHESSFPLLRERGVRRQLERARQVVAAGRSDDAR